MLFATFLRRFCLPSRFPALCLSCLLPSHSVLVLIYQFIGTCNNSKKNNYFNPVSIETVGPFSIISQLFISDVGRRISQRILDPRETAFLYQRISVAIQVLSLSV